MRTPGAAHKRDIISWAFAATPSPQTFGMHILIPDDLRPSAVALFTEAGWKTDARAGRPRQQLLADVAAADALIVRSATMVDAELIAAAPRLRVIARAGVGVDNVDVAAAGRRGIVVMNAPEATTTSVAELTLAGLLNLARHVCAADRSMKAGAWEKKAFSGTELAGKTLGVVGYGRIGRRVALLATAFGMRVLAHDAAPAGPAGGVQFAPLDVVCAEADYISLHVPVNAATRRLFDRARLARCKPGVRLVNTARGELIDEAALLEALDSGQVGGAALDVFATEPPVDLVADAASGGRGDAACRGLDHRGAGTGRHRSRVGRPRLPADRRGTQRRHASGGLRVRAGGGPGARRRHGCRTTPVASISTTSEPSGSRSSSPSSHTSPPPLTTAVRWPSASTAIPKTRHDGVAGSGAAGVSTSASGAAATSTRSPRPLSHQRVLAPGGEGERVSRVQRRGDRRRDRLEGDPRQRHVGPRGDRPRRTSLRGGRRRTHPRGREPAGEEADGHERASEPMSVRAHRPEA